MLGLFLVVQAWALPFFVGMRDLIGYVAPGSFASSVRSVVEWYRLASLIGLFVGLLGLVTYAVKSVMSSSQAPGTTTPLTIRFMPATLHVSGRVGRWPLRKEHVFPLKGIRLEHRGFDYRRRVDPNDLDQPLQPSGDSLRSLIIKQDGKVISFDGLFASEVELDEAIRQVEAAMRAARDRIGDGESEIPEDLRKILRPTREML